MAKNRESSFVSMFSRPLRATLLVSALSIPLLTTVARAEEPVPATAPAAAAPAPAGDFLTRLADYYQLEWGEAGPPADPNAPPSRREGWPATPQSTPPMPFTEWPYGGTTSIGVTRPSSVDSPLMAALAPTGAGEWLNDAHIQVYGWVDVGGNLSTNHVRGGNAPAAYDYNPNTFQLDQAVVYIERLPDTVQQDKIDWGFRLSAIYGENYRYTTSMGLASWQYLKKNNTYGYDFPMMYGELYIPQVAEGLVLRLGRFIALPDIEAQLAPNNYMYSHSLGYTFDNYTNTGLQATLAATKNLFLQFGVSVGSDTALWNGGAHVHNPYPNPLYPNSTFLKDPGAMPTFTGCARYQTDSGNDNIYLCADAINGGDWGYNNLQWYGFTYYHKFNEQWHIAFEAYNLHQDGVPNLRNPVVTDAMANGGTPFSTPQFRYNAPGGAYCNNAEALRCRATAETLLTYLNYQFSPLDNLSFRAEFYDDLQGQRTGTRTRYTEFGVGLQHWFSPQVEIRPEVVYYRALDAKAFDGNSNYGIPASRYASVNFAGDLIVHF